jgi:3-hydroxyisobutyrate dehydrogenase
MSGGEGPRGEGPQVAATGFIGLGQMGAPMAARLVDWPGGLVVCDADSDATAALADAGALVAPTPRAVAERAQVVSVMVRDEVQVQEVVLGSDGIVHGAEPGVIVAIHSPVSPGAATALADQVAPHGVAIVDAPVSGGILGAHDGTLAVMAGGSGPAVERCRDVFARWASVIVHVGPTGAGTRAKLARNLIQFVSYAAAGEAQRLAEAAGVDLRALADVVRHTDAVMGGPASVMQRDTAMPLSRADEWYEPLEHVRWLGETDLSLALDLARELGVEVPLAEVALDELATGLGLSGRGRTGPDVSGRT